MAVWVISKEQTEGQAGEAQQRLEFIQPSAAQALGTRLLSLKLQMTQASLCHEYARLEHDKTVCITRRGELQDEMGAYHQTYQDAKGALLEEDPCLVQEIEHDLLCQKQLVFNDLQA